MTAQDPGLLPSEELVEAIESELVRHAHEGASYVNCVKAEYALVALIEIADRLLLCEEGIRQAQATPFDDDQITIRKVTEIPEST